MLQAAFLPWWVSLPQASFQLLASWELQPFSHQKLLLLCNSNSLLSFFSTAGFLPGIPFSCDLTSGAAAALSTRSLWFLAWRRMVFQCMDFASEFSFKPNDSQVFQWILSQDSDESSCVVLRGLFGSLGFSRFC